jgi:hypothetical protein
VPRDTLRARPWHAFGSDTVRHDLLHRMICYELLSNSKITYGASEQIVVLAARTHLPWGSARVCVSDVYPTSARAPGL